MAPGRTSPDGLRRRRLFGLDFIDAPTLDDVVEHLLGQPSPAGEGDPAPDSLPVVVTPNVDILVSLDRDRDGPAADVFRQAQYVLPDGMPVVVASRLLGRPLAARLPGSELFELLWPRLAEDRRRVVVLCANDGIAERLSREHPDARFLVPGMIDVGNDEQLALASKELFELVEEHDAEFVLLGLGHPKDAVLIGRLHALWRTAGLDGRLCLGLGGSFAMYVGQRKRAPKLVQRIGLEWFYRFAQEPRRLFRRYFVEDLAFFGLVRRERRRRADDGHEVRP